MSSDLETGTATHDEEQSDRFVDLIADLVLATTAGGG
jgi:hypothetical protein